MECEFCHHKFNNKSSLKNHQRRAKYCLKLRGKEEYNFECSGCGKKYTSKENLQMHEASCISVNSNTYKNIIESKDNEIKELKVHIKELEKQIQEIALKAVSQNFEDETTIEINEDDFLSDSDFTIEEETDTEEEYKQLPPLEVGKGYTIEHREEDGYINVTNLCKAGNKQFKHWKCLEKTMVLKILILVKTSNRIKKSKLHSRTFHKKSWNKEARRTVKNA